MDCFYFLAGGSKQTDLKLTGKSTFINIHPAEVNRTVKPSAGARGFVKVSAGSIIQKWSFLIGQSFLWVWVGMLKTSEEAGRTDHGLDRSKRP